MFKKYPQLPFKKFVKTEHGKVLTVEPYNNIEPAVFNKNGKPLTRFGYTITYTEYFADGSGCITYIDRIVATADNVKELK